MGRLYRALELLAQIHLLAGYEIKDLIGIVLCSWIGYSNCTFQESNISHATAILLSSFIT
ncbi:MAG: hypothetical protein ACLFM2_00640 [Halothece sp.]